MALKVITITMLKWNNKYINESRMILNRLFAYFAGNRFKAKCQVIVSF